MIDFFKDWGLGEWTLAVAVLALITAVIFGILQWRFPKRFPTLKKTAKRADWPQFYNIPESARDIRGRSKAVKDIKRLIDTTPIALTGGRSKVVAIHGSGGIGKSELANEFARIYKQDYEGLWPVRAESETTLHQDIEALGEAMGYTPDLSPKNKTLAILKHIAERKAPWLIIYDNVTGQGAINDYLVAGVRLHYLITTRSTVWDKIQCYPVRLLDKDAALALLQQTSGRDDADLHEIVKKLDGYPLALVVAGAYLKNGHRATVKAYLENFDKRITELYAADYAPTRDENIKDQYPASILGSLSLSFDTLSDDAKDLLSLSSFLSPDDIWLEMIEAGAKDEDDDGAHPWPDFIDRINAAPSRLNDAMTELKAASLIEVEGERLTMHRLTQAVVKVGLKDKTQTDDDARDLKLKIWADTAIRMMNAVTPYDTGSPANWVQLDRLLPHVEGVLGDVPNSKAADRAIGQMGAYTKQRGNYELATFLLETVLGISESVNGKNSNSHARRLNNLAVAYEDNNQLNEAEKRYEASLAIERNYARLNNLAGLYLKQKKFEEAESLYLEAQKLTKDSLGEDHPDYAIQLGNIGNFYRTWSREKTLTDDKQALILDYETRALQISVAAHGHWHQDTAGSLNNLAVNYYTNAEGAKAVEMMRRAAATRLDVLGQNDARTQHSLSAWLKLCFGDSATDTQIEGALQTLPQEIKALRREHVKWGLEKIAELESRYSADGPDALAAAVKAETNRLINDGAPVEKYEWVESEFRGADFALAKGREWGIIDPAAET